MPLILDTRLVFSNGYSGNMLKNIWIHQLDYVKGAKGSYPENFFRNPALKDSILGKKLIRTSDRLSIAFLGESLYFRQAAIENRYSDVDCKFVSFVFGENPTSAIRELVAFNPDIVIVFRPELHEHFQDFLSERVAVGYFTEPISRKINSRHQELVENGELLKKSFLTQPGVFDLFVGYNPIFAKSLESLFDIWTYFPVPVRDDLIHTSSEDQRSLSVDTGVFVGRENFYKSRFIEPIRQKYGWLTVDSSSNINLLDYSIALNLHNGNYSNSETAHFLHLALGRLVLTEPQEPRLDLSPGFTHLEFRSPKELLDILEFIESSPKQVNDLRENGRKFVRRYSSTNTWSKLIEDLTEVLT